MSTVQLGSVPVGDSHPVVLVAEIGTFFNQDLGLARQYLAQIAAAGVPVFKTEILHDADVCLRSSGLNATFTHASGKQVEDYRALIERKVVPLAGYARIFAECRELRIPFIASVYDFEGIDFLVREGAAGIKIARHNITHLPLIRHAARTRLPVIFDAGVVYLDEIAAAVRAAQNEGAPVIVNHHPGANPTPPERHNLRVIQTWKETFDVPVGLSCHYRGEELLYAAVGVGVNLIEKGVVDDNTRVEQDVVSAINLADLKAFHQRLLNCSAALGARLPVIAEPRDLSTRKGLSARRAIKAGEALTLESVAFAWPPLGVRVECWDEVKGRVVAKDISAGEPIHWADIDFAK
jgi:sialic acid synthase SpsE